MGGKKALGEQEEEKKTFTFSPPPFPGVRVELQIQQEISHSSSCTFKNKGGRNLPLPSLCDKNLH